MIMQLNKQEMAGLKKWVAALRSGKYEQGVARLQSDTGFCCLGVACKELIAKPNLDSDGKLVGHYLNRQDDAPKWLVKLVRDFSDKFELTDLPLLNDSRSHNFDEIADLLELIYIHKALE